MEHITTPAIYVGTWQQYNAGSLYGQWFDLTEFDDKDDFYAACHALHAGEADPELMFQDIEGIPGQFASESSISWPFIDAWKQAFEDGNAAAFVAWSGYTGRCDYDAFENAYCGEAESEEAFATGQLEDSGVLNEIPEALRGYFDYEAWARDLFLNEYDLVDGYVFSH